LILCRGGGSLEDLWAFNTEVVVHAVAESQRPLVCGVGHETDITLADLAADVRAATPTAAAELVAPVAQEQLFMLAAKGDRLRLLLNRTLDAQAQRLDQVSLRLRQPAGTLAWHHSRLNALAQRHRAAGARVLVAQHQTLLRAEGTLARAASVATGLHRQGLHTLGARLAAVDPRRVLLRGYTWVEDAQGNPVASVSQVEPGQVLRAVWADGVAQTRVESVSQGTTPLGWE
jgi:exodeoxyribonuclease VII large subunit